jgi:hypothetical protein
MTSIKQSLYCKIPQPSCKILDALQLSEISTRLQRRYNHCKGQLRELLSSPLISITMNLDASRSLLEPFTYSVDSIYSIFCFWLLIGEKSLQTTTTQPYHASSSNQILLEIITDHIHNSDKHQIRAIVAVQYAILLHYRNTWPNMPTYHEVSKL